MKLAQTKICPLLILVLPEQTHDLPLAHHVRDLLGRTCGSACCFTRGRLTIQSSSFHEVLHRLVEGPPSRMQIHIYSDSRCAISRKPKDLSLACGVVGVQT